MRKLNRILAARDMSISQLAAKAGISMGHVYNLISGTTVTKRGRARLEDALKVPLWTDPLDFVRRQQAAQHSKKRET